MSYYVFSVTLIVFSLNVLSAENYYREKSSLMGTDFLIVIDEDNKTLCKKASKEAFGEVLRLNHIFSDYINDSEISLLSASSYDGDFRNVSTDLFKLLRISNQVSEKTQGAFDVTLGPLSRIWRVSRFRNSMPNKQKLLQAQKRVGFKKIKFHPNEKKVALQTPGMILDMGGIAKGYAADRMLSVMRANGITRCLIDAGGDLVIGKPPRGKKGWRVRIGEKIEDPLEVLSLSECAIATSGDVEQSVSIGDRKFSHIIDPSTGIGLTTSVQVTVIANDGTHADAYASAFSVMGFEKAKNLSHDQNPSLITAYFQNQKGRKAHVETISFR